VTQRYIALLRGINVGGHRVKMPELRAHFEELGFAAVETFIASGNVIFSAAGDEAGLQRQIELHLRQALGYDVPTFLRTPAELAAVAAHEPFPDQAPVAASDTLSVMFLAAAAPPELAEQLAALQTSYDSLRAHGREIYWLCRGKTTDSLIDWAKAGKRVKMPLTTARNATTVRKLSALYPPFV
jgi:uncharacterized protein (DUF1697 family)